MQRFLTMYWPHREVRNHLSSLSCQERAEAGGDGFDTAVTPAPSGSATSTMRSPLPPLIDAGLSPALPCGAVTTGSLVARNGPSDISAGSPCGVTRLAG